MTGQKATQRNDKGGHLPPRIKMIGHSYPFDIHNVLFRVKKKGVTGNRYLLEYNAQNVRKRDKKGVTLSHDVLS